MSSNSSPTTPSPQSFKTDDPWELYHIKTEQNDLAATQPKRVATMLKKLQAEADRTLIFPLR